VDLGLVGREKQQEHPHQTNPTSHSTHPHRPLPQPQHQQPQQTLITHGVLLEAGGLLLLGPPPPLLSHAAHSPNSSTQGQLIAAWVMTVVGMMCMGTGQGLIAMPAVDAMRTTIMARQREHVRARRHAQGQRLQRRRWRRQRRLGQQGEEGEGEGVEEDETDSACGEGGGAMDEELASVMSFTISLGAFAGPMLGGLGIQYLPPSREWGCPVAHPPDGRFGTDPTAAVECASGYRWTTLVLSAVTFLVWALLYAHTRGQGKEGGEEGGEEVEEEDEDGRRQQQQQQQQTGPPLLAIAVQRDVGKPQHRNVAVTAAAMNGGVTGGGGGDVGYGHFWEEEQKEERLGLEIEEGMMVLGPLQEQEQPQQEPPPPPPLGV
jgi:hypothetical protein